MYVHTLKRLMIGRKIVQKGETVSVSQKEGRELIEKGSVVNVKTPDPADSKAKTTKKKTVEAAYVVEIDNDDL